MDLIARSVLADFSLSQNGSNVCSYVMMYVFMSTIILYSIIASSSLSLLFLLLFKSLLLSASLSLINSKSHTAAYIIVLSNDVWFENG